MALTAAGAEQGPDGRWHAPPDVRVPDRYRVIVERAAGRDLTRAGMIEILISAGYTRSSATGRMSSSHPLFERIGPNRYRLIETADRTRRAAGVTKHPPITCRCRRVGRPAADPAVARTGG